MEDQIWAQLLYDRQSEAFDVNVQWVLWENRELAYFSPRRWDPEGNGIRFGSLQTDSMWKRGGGREEQSLESKIDSTKLNQLSGYAKLVKFNYTVKPAKGFHYHWPLMTCKSRDNYSTTNRNLMKWWFAEG